MNIRKIQFICLNFKVPVDAEGNEIGEAVIEYQQEPKEANAAAKVSFNLK